MNWKKSFETLGYVNTYTKSERVVPRCKSCGLRRRGVNHDDGAQHKARSK